MKHARPLALLAFVVMVILALIACGVAPPKGGGASLPYYDGSEFTPRWSPVDHRVAEFRLTTQRGDLLTADSLRGKIHIASFVYTRCAAICPILIRELTKVQQAVKTLQDVVLVSYSVTPNTDTPSALADFGRERLIDPDRWRLVTGDRQAIWRLARDSYFADDARALEGDPAPEAAFLHTEKVLLVDWQLRLRGVYNGTSASDLEHLVADVRQLEDELGR